MQLVVMGGGRMGEALVGGLLRHGALGPADVAVVEVSAARRLELRERFPGVHVDEDPVPAPGAVVAVKPHDVEAACARLRDLAPAPQRVLSIAAGVPTESLEGALPASTAVVRAMPNTPALVGAGVSAVAGGRRAGDDDLAWAEDVLGAVGSVVRVPERLLDAVTGLSGSGPGYVFLVAEAMIDAGVLVGLSRDVAATLVAHTLAGAGRLLVESGQSAHELRAAVTSPGGTTMAGLRALEDRAVRAAFLAAVAAATDRSRELGT